MRTCGAPAHRHTTLELPKHCPSASTGAPISEHPIGVRVHTLQYAPL